MFSGRWQSVRSKNYTYLYSARVTRFKFRLSLQVSHYLITRPRTHSTRRIYGGGEVRVYIDLAVPYANPLTVA